MKNRLKVLRAERNLTQEALAELSDCTRQTINAIEKGKYNPGIRLTFRLSRALKVPIEQIFMYEDEVQETKTPASEEEHRRGYR